MDFWRLYPRPSDLERGYGFTLWFAEQCLGVAKGLQMIHTLDVPDTEGLDSRSRHQIHGRHGDLKPENILWFKTYQKGDQIQQMGVLKISDFGLTRFHRTMSRSHISSDSLAVSPTYRAPEYDVCKMVSQSYDIWTLACILLEFITWYLLGWQEVDTFARKRTDEDNSMIKEDTFFNFVNIKDESGRVQTGAKAKQSVANVGPYALTFCLLHHTTLAN
jgi:serine/threonine protein kinase